MDTTHLVCLYLLARLLQAELEKCLQLVISLPMTDMEHYFGEDEGVGEVRGTTLMRVREGDFIKSSTLNVSLDERKNDKTCNKLAKYDTNYLNAIKAKEFNQKLSYLCNCVLDAREPVIESQ